MSLIPYEPFRFLDPLWDEMDRFMRRGRGKEDLSQWLYRIDIDETPSEVIVTAEIPGIEKPEDLYISVNDNILTVQGEIRRETQKEERVTRYTERYYGKFSRSIQLPSPVKADGAHATYRNGVLELRFLKDANPAARRIEVDFKH